MDDKPWIKPKDRMPRSGKVVLARYRWDKGEMIYPPRYERVIVQSVHDAIGEDNSDVTIGLCWTRVSDGIVLNYPDEWQEL